jgi:hypothetical protein
MCWERELWRCCIYACREMLENNVYDMNFEWVTNVKRS